MSLLVLCAVGLILRSTAKRYVTAETQRSPRKMLYRVLTRPGVSAVRFCRACPAEAQRSPRKMLYCALERMRHGAIRLVFAILRAPGVSAARFCSEVMLETHPCRKRRSITAPIRVSEGSISCFGLKRVSELLEQHMSSDHTPVWIRLLRLSEAPFVAAYRLRRRGNAAMMAGARVCGEE
jgi:hypothetical protein